MRPNGPVKLVCLLSEASFRCFGGKNFPRSRAMKSILPTKNMVCDYSLSFSTMSRIGASRPSVTGTTILNYVAWQMFSLSECQFWPSIYQSQAGSADCLFPPFKKQLWNCLRKLNYSDQRSRDLCHLHLLPMVVNCYNTKDI